MIVDRKYSAVLIVLLSYVVTQLVLISNENHVIYIFAFRNAIQFVIMSTPKSGFSEQLQFMVRNK